MSALGQDGRMADHPHTIDRWDEAIGEIEQIAGVGDYLVALETYRAAAKRWPAGQPGAGDRAELGGLTSPRTHSGPKYRAIMPTSPTAKRTPKRRGAAIRVANTIRVVIIGSVSHTHTQMCRSPARTGSCPCPHPATAGSFFWADVVCTHPTSARMRPAGGGFGSAIIAGPASGVLIIGMVDQYSRQAQRYELFLRSIWGPTM
jgi:hypothetical protein